MVKPAPTILVWYGIEPVLYGYTAPVGDRNKYWYQFRNPCAETKDKKRKQKTYFNLAILENI